MKHADEMNSDGMIYIYIKFNKNLFRHSEVNKRGYTDTRTERLSQKHKLIF
jgi:hypothetical protein